MTHNITLIVYPAKNLVTSKKFFTTYLGIEPYVDTDYYVGYRLKDHEVGLDPNGSSIINYTDVDSIEEALKLLKDLGAIVVKDMNDVGNGLMIAQVEIDGNILGIRQQPGSKS